MEEQIQRKHIEAIVAYVNLKDEFNRLQERSDWRNPSIGELAGLAKRLEELAPKIHILELDHDASRLAQAIYMGGGFDTRKVPLVDCYKAPKELELVTFTELFPSGLPEEYKRNYL